MISSWVEFGWICELIVVIFHVQSSLGGLTNLDELINVLLVGEVLVKVILEVLDHVHVLLDEIISSDLLEWESVIVELPGLDLWVWIFALLLKLSIDGHGGVVMSLIEASGEVVHLDVHLVDRDLLTTWGWDEIIRVWVVAVMDWEWNGLRSSSDGDEGGEFHLNYLIYN